MTKVHENWIHDYWSENTFNGIFHFFCQCYRTRVSADRFSCVPLFHYFYPKIDSDAHFFLCFLKYWGIKQKSDKRCSIFHYKNENIYIFYAFINGFRNMLESREFRQKNKAKPSQGAYFANFFSKNRSTYRKTINADLFFFFFFFCKNKYFCKFFVRAFRKILESIEFRFENTLKRRDWK